jgi:hypothetical protein
MQFRKTLGVFSVALLATLATAPAAQASHELEGFLAWYFPSTLELEPFNAEIDYQDTLGFGARYGYRADTSPWGISITYSRVDLDSANPEVIGCSTCDFDVEFTDFSFDWYPGNHDWDLFAGLGWATGGFDIDVPGDSNDREISDDAFTWHVGTAYSWRIGESFYLRPDLRVRFLELDDSGQGKYDSEDFEARLGFGWRF